MATLLSFAPNLNASPPFRFNATLDGNPYVLTATWLIAGQRWYLNCFDSRGNHIFTLPLIGSPDCLIFSSLTAMPSGLVTAIANAPHGLGIGRVYKLFVFGATLSYFHCS